MTDSSDGPDDDPTRIRSIAVHRGDVVNALEATLRTDRRVVLRMTPPYSGRMRARIHRADGSAETGDRGPGGPIHVDAADLVEEPPPYPEVDETTAALPDADVAARRERHAEAVAEWREAVRESVGGSVEIPAGGDDRGDAGGDDDDDKADDDRGSETNAHEIDVVALG